MIAIIDYGSGNLHSVQKAVAFAGAEINVTDNADDILQADKIIIPGVGAFADCMNGLEIRNLVEVVKDAASRNILILGICVGMQLLFEESEEKGLHRGLGLMPGRVVFFTQTTIKVPQIGWNQVEIAKPSPLMDGIQNGDYFYFNHSYYCAPTEMSDALTITDYGLRYASSVARGNIFGVQFHPEKSQTIGLRLLRNFVEMRNG